MKPYRARYNRAKPMPKDPVLYAVFERIDTIGMTYTRVEDRAGVNRGQLYRWRREIVRPRLDLIEAVMEVVGLRLAVVRA